MVVQKISMKSGDTLTVTNAEGVGAVVSVTGYAATTGGELKPGRKVLVCGALTVNVTTGGDFFIVKGV